MELIFQNNTIIKVFSKDKKELIQLDTKIKKVVTKSLTKIENYLHNDIKGFIFVLKKYK